MEDLGELSGVARLRVFYSGARLARIQGKPKGLGDFIGVRGIRGECQGWTDGVSARWWDCVVSLDVKALLMDYHIIGFTFTHKQIVSGTQNSRVVKQLLDRFRRLGYEWMYNKEFQERGALHQHGIICVPRSSGLDLQSIKNHIMDCWLSVASSIPGNEVLRVAQKVEVVDSVKKWQMYLAPHCVGSVKKSQRNSPDTYEGHARMWGCSSKLRREYFYKEEFRIKTSKHFYKLRRALRKYRTSFMIDNKVRNVFKYVKRLGYVGGGESITGRIKRSCRGRWTTNDYGEFVNLDSSYMLSTSLPISLWINPESVYKLIAELIPDGYYQLSLL